MATCLIQHDLVTQDVDTPNSSPYLNKVDLSIPTGTLVTGSGAIVTHGWDDGTEALVPVASLADSTVAGQVANLRISDGPHPSDSTKWRVMLSQTSAQRLRVRVWITVVG
jgi:hypothetical protein